MSPIRPTLMSRRVRRAFRRLDRQPREILERVLFEGATCSEIARTLHVPTCEVRATMISGMRALRAATDTPCTIVVGMDGLLALHALRALDADETVLVDLVICRNPTLGPPYRSDRELVAALYASWTTRPRKCVYRRLVASVAEAGLE